MAVVEEYWSGVLRRLQAEVEGFNRLIGHAGERGRENELALTRILQPLVPARYAVGTGMVIDSSDQASKQCDVVLFEQADQPRLLAQTTQLLHPVETVRAVIEVKTTLRPVEVEDAGAKKASIDALHPIGLQRDGSSHPLFFLFAYAADASPATVAANLLALPDERRPDLVCLITPGVVGGRSDLLRPTVGDGNPGGAGYVVGATCLLGRDRTVVGWSDMGPAGVHDGGTYPVIARGNGFVLGDPARALLLFTDGLLRGLAALDGFPPPVTSSYISDDARRIEQLA